MRGYIYISGALMNAADLDKSRRLYEFAEDVCQQKGLTAYVPHKHTDPEFNASISPAEVYKIDSHRIKTADGMIAFVHEPSLGVGMEVMLAVQHKIPTLCLNQKGMRLSRYLRGFMLHHNYDDVVAYDSEAELRERITAWIDRTYQTVIFSQNL